MRAIIQKTIQELLSLEAYHEEGKKRCCKARKMLERVYAPAPLRGNKTALTAEEKNALRAGLRKTMSPTKQKK